MHQTFVNELEAIAHDKNGNAIKNIRLLGTILAFEVDAGKDEYLNSISQTITRQALALGIFLRPLGNTVYIMPPYCITDSQLQQVYDAIRRILLENKNAARDEAAFEGFEKEA